MRDHPRPSFARLVVTPLIVIVAGALVGGLLGAAVGGIIGIIYIVVAARR